jgi:hypothetical protein
MLLVVVMCDVWCVMCAGLLYCCCFYCNNVLNLIHKQKNTTSGKRNTQRTYRIDCYSSSSSFDVVGGGDV